MCNCKPEYVSGNVAKLRFYRFKFYVDKHDNSTYYAAIVTKR